MSTLPRTPLTAQQYLEIERKAEVKSEFYRGEMFAMSGGSLPHSRLGVRIVSLLDRHLEGRGCEVCNSDLLVHADESDAYMYPDASVFCGKARFADGHTDILLNPVLVVEVLSPSTENFDRGKKLKLYRTIPSLLECLLVSQNTPEIELYRRENGDNWRIITAKSLDSTLELTSIDYLLPLRDLYHGILPGA